MDVEGREIVSREVLVSRRVYTHTAGSSAPAWVTKRTFRKYEFRLHRTFRKYEFAVGYMKVVEITPFFGVFGQILTREACRSRVSSQFSALHGTRSQLYDHKIPIFTLAKLHQAGTHQKVSETKTQIEEASHSLNRLAPTQHEGDRVDGVLGRHSF